MIASERERDHEDTIRLDLAVASALQRYGLVGLEVTCLDAQDGALFHLQVPVGFARIHPTLGRIDGQSFLLKLREGANGEAELRREARWAAVLLRETDLPVLEPVAACDGSLVARLGATEETYSVLFRGEAWEPDNIVSSHASFLNLMMNSSELAPGRG